jgi:aryl-alcohol dehydrogenase-like predicted oxidoreductase
MIDSRRVERRRLAGSTLEVSAIGAAIDPAPIASPEADDQLVGQIRRLRRAGVTTYDLSAARSVARATRVVRGALSRGDSEVCVIVAESHPAGQKGRSAHGPGAPDVPHDRPPDAEDMEASLSGLRDLGTVLVQGASESPSVVSGGLPSGGYLIPWSPQGGRLGSPGAPGAKNWLSTELSLLDTRSLASLRSENRSGAPRVFVRNPFADGRLDGSRFGGLAGVQGRVASPIDVRSLHQDFDPVLRLAPLTRERRRTLAQAAIRFALRWPWVATVLLPPEPPERWGELIDSLSTPELTDDELRAAGVL